MTRAVDDEFAYTRTPGFKYGFVIARRLVEPAFRKRLEEAKRPSDASYGDCLVPACPDEPFADILGRMTHYERGLIVIPDLSQPQDIQVIRWEKH